MASRRSRIIGVIGAGAISKLILVVGQLVCVPIFTISWGASGYGEWLALTAFTSYLAFSNFGAPGAIRSEIAIGLSSGDLPRARSAYLSGLSIIGFFIVPVALALSGLAVFSPIVARDVSPLFTAGTIQLVLAALVWQVSLVVCCGIVSSALAGIGLYALTTLADAGRQATEFLLIGCGLLLLHVSPVQLAISLPFIGLIELLFLLILLVVRAPWLFYPLQFPALARIKELGKPMIGILAMGLGYYGMSVQFPRIMVSMLLGPAAVAAYAVATMLLRLSRTMIDVIAHASSVEISNAYGSGDLTNAGRLIVRTMQVCLWLSLCLVPAFILLGPTAIHIWTSGKVSVDWLLLSCLGSSTVVFAIGLTCQEALMAVGKLGKVTLPLLIFAPFYGMFAFGLTRLAGLPGSGFALIILDVCYAVLGIYSVMSVFDLPLAKIIRVLVRPPRLGL